MQIDSDKFAAPGMTGLTHMIIKMCKQNPLIRGAFYF
jgi:hypothetical protein